jgi:hypothetical protein
VFGFGYDQSLVELVVCIIISYNLEITTEGGLA